jgi:hypothetical protein
MPNSQNYASPEQFAANRANAARSTGPRSPEGKTRSAQNARKHGFAAAAYTVIRFEDVAEVTALKDDLVAFYQPVNSQEHFAVERMALAQLAILRTARLEAGFFMSCLSQALNIPDPILTEMDPNLTADIEVAREQNHNFLLAGGFQHIAANSNALSLCLRYAAQAERQYRRAVEEFDRLKALRPQIPNDPDSEVQPDLTAPAAAFGETNPIPPEAPQNEGLTCVPSSQPEIIPAAPAALPARPSQPSPSESSAPGPQFAATGRPLPTDT